MISHTVVAAGFSTYQPFSFTQSIANVSISIFLTTLVISILFIIYRVKIKKQEAHLPSSNYVICFQIYIEFIRNMVIEVLGKKFEKITPFFIYLFSYILLSNTISIFGFANPTSSLSVTLSLGVVTFVGIFVIGIKYQKWSFLKKYTFNINTKKKSIPVMINPLNIIGQITPLISLSFRLWGNIFAGTLITTMLLVSTQNAMDSVLPFHFFNVIGVFILIPLHIYFDLLSGLIQAFVFFLLTMVYWKMETNEKDSI